MICIKRASLIFILFSSLCFLAGCSSEKPESIDRSIARKWQYNSIAGADGQAVRQVGDSDFLILSESDSVKSFSYSLALENTHASGTWSVTDSILSLTYNREPYHSKVDSIVFYLNETEGELSLFQGEKEVGKISNKGVSPILLSRHFRILKLTPDQLVINEAGVTFSYSYRPASVEGQVSLASVGRGLLGLFCLVLILYFFSVDRKRIQWKLVLTGLLLQLIIAIGVLKVDVIKNVFEFLGNVFVTILAFTLEGSRFVFGDMVNPSGSIGFVFAFQILPTIIFFSALTSLLFYLGVLQKIVYGLAWIMSKTMKLSGAESLAAAANIFLGQTEAPLMVKPYISRMTRSELLCLMTGGMATIAGGVMAAFIGFLGGDDPAMRLFFAKHLLAASVMSAPAAIVAAKILIPQTQKIDENLVVSKERIGKNMLEAISIGTGEGLRLAVNVGAMLLVFIALIAMVNFMLKDFIGNMGGINERIVEFSNGRYSGLTMQFVLGYVCAPLSWLMGVCREDMVLVGQLLGEKTILNEFVAYTSLGQMQAATLFTEQKSIIIATYVLCGFANFASIGIQIGGIGSLAPDKRTALSELGFRALLGGTMASLFTAVIVGMLI